MLANTIKQAIFIIALTIAILVLWVNHYLNVLERHEDISTAVSSSKNFLQSAPSNHNVSIGNL